MDPTMWKSIDMRNLSDVIDLPYDLAIMCRHAVDRSRGGLVDINIEHFATHHLLKYITDRYSSFKLFWFFC